MTRLTTHQFHNKRRSMHLKVAGQRAFLYTRYLGLQPRNQGALSVRYAGFSEHVSCSL